MRLDPRFDPSDQYDTERGYDYGVGHDDRTTMLTDGRTVTPMTDADLRAEKAAAGRAEAERYALLAVGGFRRQVMGGGDRRRQVPAGER